MTVMPSADDLREARERIAGLAHRTPVLTSSYFDDRFGAEIHWKCENLQKVGAFKFRGACNTVMSMTDDEAAAGVVTHSSGNHAQALALAARVRGIPAYIVMPRNAPAVKLAAVRGYGAEVFLCEPNQASREGETARIAEETGAALVHPFDDPRIVAGQATAAMELLEEVPDLDLLLAPVGGGGLLSGTALAARHFTPKTRATRTRVLGVEPKEADDAYRSLEEGRIVPSVEPTTIADGLLTSLGELTFEVIRNLTEGIVTVEEASIVEAMRLVWERMKILVEPSAAVPPAALVSGALDVTGLRVGIILSGGNVDLDRLPWQG